MYSLLSILQALTPVQLFYLGACYFWSACFICAKISDIFSNHAFYETDLKINPQVLAYFGHKLIFWKLYTGHLTIFNRYRGSTKTQLSGCYLCRRKLFPLSYNIMSNLLSQDHAALQMLFTDDIYFIPEKISNFKKTQPDIKNEETLTVVPATSPSVKPIHHPEKTETVSKLPIGEVENPLRPEPSMAVQTDFEYQGDNNKYFLILIDDKIHTRMNPVHLEMLLKVMTAKKLELRDLAILNIGRYPDVNFTALKSFFSCSKLVLFGVQPEQIGLPKIKLNTTETKNNVKMLATYSLEEMRNSPEKKREFWNVMKNL